MAETKKPKTSSNKQSFDTTPLFGKDNYRWMIIGIAIVGLGLILMGGGKSKDPNVFDPNQVYSFTRITIAPILILLGLGIEIYALFKRKKENTCIVDDVEDDVIIPMKANNWELDDDKDPQSVQLKVKKYFMRCEGKGKKMVLHDEEFYCQPKLDGWRCRVNFVDGKIVMYSNSGKQYAWFTSLRKLLLKWFSSLKNIEKLLKNLADNKNREAQFRTVISLILNDKEYFFEGICVGKIISEQRGENGFGYDPIFIPEGSNRTFAEMRSDEKNMFSHRKKAGDKLITFLQEYYGKN